MNYLSVEKLSKSYGEQSLFHDLSFGIDQGQKVALVARNGSGKSTLFRLISKQEAADTGSITFNLKARLAFLHQEPALKNKQSIIDAIFESDNEKIKLIKRYELATTASDTDKIQELIPEMDRLEAWDFEQKVREILNRFKISNLGQKIGQLSGGQKKRVALARVLLQEADFLLLDEPTNHLDPDMIDWLENYLGQQQITLLMVTHDRYFLERICNEIFELDDQQIFRYKGNYSYFLQKKNERELKESLDVQKARNLLRKELDWIRRMPKARGTKSKDRIERFYKLEKQAGKDLSEDPLKLEILHRRLGGKILELHNVSKAYDGKLLIDNFSYLFQKAEKIGIAGPNGSGKTTLLNLVTGSILPDSGEIIKGETVKMAYYRQEIITFDPEKRVIDVVRDIAEFIPVKNGMQISAAQMLERFLFSRKMHYVPVRKLSGGEKRRLHLLCVLMENPNFLILDEPTNDLDILTLNVLEEFLLDYEGCLLIVTHDRYFLDKIVDHLFIFEAKGIIRDYHGRYSDYRNKKSVSSSKQKKTKERTKHIEIKEEKTKLSYKEKREFEKLEIEIEELEVKKKNIEDSLSSQSLDHKELTELSEELNRLQEEIETKTNRWLELSEIG